MPGLLEPYIPNVGNMLESATQGYKLGEAQRQRNLSVEAGGLAAGGNLKGARDALYKGGDFSGAGQIDEKLLSAAKTAKTEQLEKAAKIHALMGNAAMIADTPEKWGKMIGGMQERGIDVSKYRDFSSRDFALAQAGKVKEFLDLELNRRKTDILAEKANAPKPRNLSLGDITKLQEKGSQFENATRYGDTFKDENAGYGLGGDTAMWTARNFPIFTGKQTEDAATWWQDYDRYKNQVRNDLFGSALTTPERDEFEKADINPNMDPKQIRRNLDRQREAVKSALRKTTGALKASGYPGEAVDEAVGVGEDDLAPAPDAGGGGERVRINLGRGTQQPGAKNDPLGILD